MKNLCNNCRFYRKLAPLDYRVCSRCKEKETVVKARQLRARRP
jgi:hypothetical protein